jgi:hypothetical protein
MAFHPDSAALNCEAPRLQFGARRRRAALPSHRSGGKRPHSPRRAPASMPSPAQRSRTAASGFECGSQDSRGAVPPRAPSRRTNAAGGTAGSFPTLTRDACHAAIVCCVGPSKNQCFVSAYSSAPRKCNETYGSSPTTQLSCPGAI